MNRFTPVVELSPEVRARVERAVLHYALRGEATLSIARAWFCAVVLVRFVLTDSGDGLIWSRAPFELPVVAAIVFSMFAYRWIKQGSATARLVFLSTVVDALVCGSSLLQNQVFPWPKYGGLLAHPDCGAIIITTAIAGLRQSPQVGLLSAVLNGAVAVTLLGLDRLLVPYPLRYGTGDIVLFLIILSAAGLVAVMTSVLSRRLAETSALESTQLARAENELRLLLDEHHNAKTILSASTLEAELLLVEEVSPNLRGRLEGLLGDLRRLHDATLKIREYSWAELLALTESQATDVGACAKEMLPALQQRNRTIRVTLDVRAHPPALVAGGASTVRRILIALISNAAEGDGQRAAENAHIQVFEGQGRVKIVVSDDGPGFPVSLVHAGHADGLSMKAGGSGFGLLLLRQVVDLSGGTLTLANESVGARVEIGLRPA